MAKKASVKSASKTVKAPAKAKQAGTKATAKTSSKGVARKKATQKAATHKTGASRPPKPSKAPGKSQKTATKETTYSLVEGDRAPAFSVASTSGKTLSLSDLKGKKAVLYFYPKDNTPGCTLEGYDFKKLHSAFQKAGTVILGVSKDTLRSHDGFKTKCGFPFELLSDEDGSLCKAFDVIQMKSLYGRKFEGIERSTFVIDGKGVVRRAWRKVKVAGHADEVLEFVKGLES